MSLHAISVFDKVQNEALKKLYLKSTINSYRAGWFFEVFTFVEKWSISHLSTALSIFNSIRMKKCELKSCKNIHNLSSHFKVIKFCFEIFNSDQS